MAGCPFDLAEYCHPAQDLLLPLSHFGEGTRRLLRPFRAAYTHTFSRQVMECGGGGGGGAIYQSVQSHTPAAAAAAAAAAAPNLRFGRAHAQHAGGGPSSSPYCVNLGHCARLATQFPV